MSVRETPLSKARWASSLLSLNSSQGALVMERYLGFSSMIFDKFHLMEATKEIKDSLRLRCTLKGYCNKQSPFIWLLKFKKKSINIQKRKTNDRGENNQTKKEDRI